VYSLIDEVDSESIADEFDIGKLNETHGFDNHITIAGRERTDPSDSLKELEETTDSDDEMDKMAASTFSRYTNDRDYGAVVQLPFAILHTPEFSHQRAVQRKRLKHLLRSVIAVDATNRILN
jgi:hypothetical protein